MRAARMASTIAWAWTRQMFPRVTFTSAVLLSMSPKLVMVEMRAANATPRLPLNPMNDAIRKKSSGVSRNTSQSWLVSSTRPAPTLPNPAIRKGIRTWKKTTFAVSCLMMSSWSVRIVTRCQSGVRLETVSYRWFLWNKLPEMMLCTSNPLKICDFQTFRKSYSWCLTHGDSFDEQQVEHAWSARDICWHRYLPGTDCLREHFAGWRDQKLGNFSVVLLFRSVCCECSHCCWLQSVAVHILLTLRC